MSYPTHRLVIAAVLLALVGSLSLLADIPAAQRQALIALYNSADGDNWSYKTAGKRRPSIPTALPCPARKAHGTG